MAFTYQNRMGDVYYLHEGKPPAGKRRCHMSRDARGNPIDVVRDRYDIFERTETAKLFIRKLKPSAITPFERAQVEQGLRQYGGLRHFFVEIEKKSLVVYTPSTDEHEAERVVHELAGPRLLARPGSLGDFRDMLVKKSAYIK